MMGLSARLAALVLIVLALTACLSAAAAARSTGPAPSSLVLVSPLGPYSPLPTPTPGLATAIPTATPFLTPTPTVFPTVPVAEPPYLPGLEGVTPEPFQVIVREGNQVWLVTDEGERELLIDTVTRLELYLGPRGMLETDMPAVGWGGPTADGGTLVLAVGNYPNRPRPEADPPFQVQLYLLDVSSGALRYLTDGEDPVISPDGSRVVFRRPDEGWYLVKTDPGSLPEPLPEPASGCHLRGFRWSPSGDRLAVTEYCQPEAHIALLDPDTGDFVRLHTVPNGDMDIQLYPDTYLSWSPDGQHLAYLALGSAAGEGERQQSLWLLPVAGGPPQQVTSGLPVWAYSISPDGRWVGLAALGEYWAEREVLDLWLTDSAGSRPQRLTRDEPSDWPLGWAPDGTRLVLRRSPQGVWTLDLTEGLMRQVFRDAPDVQWKPSNEAVSGGWQEPYPSPGWGAYEGEPLSLLVERDEELWLHDVAQGSDGRLLTLPSADYWTLGEVVISPDGTRLAYLVHNRFGPTLLSGHVGVIELGASDGSPEVVAQTERPTGLAWLDSTHLTYLAWNGGAPVLVAVDLETGERTEERADVLRYPSPDGRYALTRTGLLSEPSLYVLEDTSTSEAFLAVGPDQYAQFLGWSAEGSLLFVISRPGIEGSVLVVVDPEEGVRRELTTGEERITGAAWSPDGATIAYALCRPAEAGCHSPELRLVGPDGSDDQTVPMEEYLSRGEGFPPNRIYAIEDLGWSPNGEYIVFRCRHGIRMAESVWAVRPDGSGLVPLTQGERPMAVR
ncbi:MAG: hypothetical protein ACOYEW_00795 [Anaerolineae bacterium]|jgi:Tol biopolymer transport system component